MKRIFVNEKWCLGCRLCEYNCAFANKGGQAMYLALKNAVIHPNIKVEEKDGITYAVSCRHCTEPLCKKVVSQAQSKSWTALSKSTNRNASAATLAFWFALTARCQSATTA